MHRGNPNFIAAGWGEETKAFKIPCRLADRIQELRSFGLTADDFLNLLDHQKLNELHEQIREILNEALNLRANSGGAIKARIREVLNLLN